MGTSFALLMATKTNTLDIDRYFDPLFGQNPKRARLGYGSFLTFDFGQRLLHNHRYQFEYQLWIQNVDWRLLHNGKEIANSESKQGIMQVAVRSLESKSLQGVRHKDRETHFIFSGNVDLACKGYSDSADDEYCWSLYMPGTHVLLADAAGRLHDVRSDVLEPVPTTTDR